MKQIDHTFFEYHFSSDKSLMQWNAIHDWLSTQSYWSKNIPFETVKSAGENSFCIGVFYQDVQVGYARIITDFSTFGYLADVYIVQAHRKKGLSKQLMECIMQLDWIHGLRKFMLATQDAHELYKKYGFVPPVNPNRLMEISKPEIYKKNGD
jgi:GNAT superfamily N-acetyltransferase